MASPRVVVRQRKPRCASVLSRPRPTDSATVSPSVDPAPQSSINTHWLRSSTCSQANGPKSDGDSPPGKKRRLDDGPEVPVSSTSKRSAPVREQRHKVPRSSPSSLATSCKITESSVIASERRKSLRSKTGSSPRPDNLLRQEPDSGRHSHPRSNHRTSDRTLGEKVAGLMKESDRLQKIVVTTAQTAEVLTKQVVSFKKINRQQETQIGKLKYANKKIGNKLNMIRENLQCQICLELLVLPHALAPCGHVFCQKCLQNWFQSAPHRDEENVGRLPATLRNQTCPCCRSSVRNRPIPLFALKNALCAFASNAQTFYESGPDPWKDIFASDLDSSKSGGSELSEMESGTDSHFEDVDSDSDELRTSRGSESEDTDEEMETDEDGGWTSSDDSSYVSIMQPPPWAPARFRHEMTREMFPDICPQHFRLLQRGVLPQMVERFSIRYDEDQGIVAWTPRGAEVYLGWNIRLPFDDYIDGRLFMSWVERNIHDEPERWLHDVSEDHPVFKRLIPRWRRHELLTPRSEDGSESEVGGASE